MPYPPICIKAYGDRSNPEYYPQIDSEGNFVPEPGDNSASSTDFVGLIIKHNEQTIFESEHGLDGKLYLTDSRIVLMCDDYESGNVLWIGNPVITAIAGVASSVAAKSRTAGKVLTGHIRFEWIESIVPTSEKLIFSLNDESIVINYRDPLQTSYSLTVTLKNVSGIAHQVDSELQKRYQQFSREQLGEKQKPPVGLPAIGQTKPSDMQYCTQCGKQIQAADPYCRHCGAKQ